MGAKVAYEFGGFRFEPFNARLIHGTTVVPVPAKAADTLTVLVRHPDVVVTKDELLQAVWPDVVVEENNLNQQISTLRRLLSPAAQSLIETVPRRGYRFVATVNVVPVNGEATLPEVIPPSMAVISGPNGSAWDHPQPATSPRRSISKSWRGLPRPAIRYGLVVVVCLAAGIPVAGQWFRERRNIRNADQIRLQAEALHRKGDFAAAVAEYQRAIDLDPGNARAYAALAHALHKQTPHDYIARPAGKSPSVQAAAQAVALDPQCATCHGTLGLFLCTHDWRWADAEKHLREAIRLDPDEEGIRPSYALLLAATGRLDDALAQIEFALARQPYQVGWRSIRASILYSQRRYPEALVAADEALAINDRERGGWEWRSRALLQLHREEEAVNAMARGLFSEHVAAIERATAEGGARGALKALLAVTNEWPRRVEQGWRRAAWLTILQEPDAAFVELERAFEVRSFNLLYVGTDPVFDALRPDPRFARLIERMGLEPYFPAHTSEIARRLPH